MKQRFNTAVGVPYSRVTLLVLALIVLPSFTLGAGSDTNSAKPEVGAPVGAETAEAQAVGVAPARTPVRPNALAMTNWDDADIGGVDHKLFEIALKAATCAVKSGAVQDPSTLTVIDYSKPSTDRRLWVYDLRNRSLLYEELVAHGQGSGANYATMFSNAPDTHRTSIGLFVTDDTYVGRNGYSLRLNGLDEGFNDRARERAIVMHGAPYVSASFVKTQGRLGRSWGCPALSEGVARDVIDTVKGGGLVFSYYPDQDWLNSSRYLGDCAAAAQ
jgi:hypothetical protein